MAAAFNSPRCTGLNKAGTQCRRAAIKGQTLCPMHGGKQPAGRGVGKGAVLARQVQRELDQLHSVVRPDMVTMQERVIRLRDSDLLDASEQIVQLTALYDAMMLQAAEEYPETGLPIGMDREYTLKLLKEIVVAKEKATNMLVKRQYLLEPAEYEEGARQIAQAGAQGLSSFYHSMAGYAMRLPADLREGYLAHLEASARTAQEDMRVLLSKAAASFDLGSPASPTPSPDNSPHSEEQEQSQDTDGGDGPGG